MKKFRGIYHKDIETLQERKGEFLSDEETIRRTVLFGITISSGSAKLRIVDKDDNNKDKKKIGF